jgi:hypothetical protein
MAGGDVVAIKTEKPLYRAKRVRMNGRMKYSLISPTGGVLHVKVLSRKNGYIILREDRRGAGK